MDARKQVLEAELKMVLAVRLAANPQVARAATEREKELRAELEQVKQPRKRPARK